MPKTKRGEHYEIDWFGDEVAFKIKGATDESIRAAAFWIESESRQNIQRNGQIDTSFMINSGYVRTEKETTYGSTQTSGSYTNKEGENVERDRAPEIQLPKGQTALVAFGANYTLWQELIQPFLFPALESAKRVTGGIIEKTAKKKGLT
jgi:hypothetical protein